MAEPYSNADVGDTEWEVHRQDDNGNQFVVETGLSRDEADRLAALLESRAHKQLYWVKRRDDDYRSLRG